MSWSGFKKNVGRATTQVMMKTGHVEKTSDRDYEVEERRYRTLESASLRLQKEAKGYLDSLRAMTASQMRIAETIDAFYGESGARDGVSRSYKQAVEDLDAETVKALDGPYRCVTRDPEIRKLVMFDEYEGLFDYGVLEEIESELNFKAGNRRHYTQGMLEDAEEGMKLIENVFRTTVLEPINRFCAYFPDINECIKKRNHKMLDYDSMRSKVKKLVEKPDKDPSKLPRTEKETEMVMNAQTFLHLDDMLFPSPPKALDGLKHTPEPEENQPRGQDSDDTSDRWNKLQADEDAAMRSVGAGLQRKPSRLKRFSAASSRLASAFFNLEEDQVNASPGTNSSHGSKSASKRSSRLFSMPSVQESPTEARQHRVFSAKAAGATGMVPMVSPQAIYSPTFDSSEKKKRANRGPEDTPSRTNNSRFRPSQTESQRTSMAPSERFTIISERTSEDFSIMSGKTWATVNTANDEDDTESIRTIRTASQVNVPPRTSSIGVTPQQIGSINSLPSRTSNGSSVPSRFDNFPPRTNRPSARTAFFHPSELEDIMGPLKEEFLEKQTNLLVQAKAAYDQLNEQLTDELPKLIDLRVPYLDPSFEALVKIQLRFCAEAYSRMAQVQQYLDASTRDQYANGDLDARVEDVLGQIRELSIAGTV